MKIQSINNTYTSVRRDSQNDSKTSFKRNWGEHISWGANFSPLSKTTNFKLFSFPDAKAVFVEIANKLSKNLLSLKERMSLFTGLPIASLALTGSLQEDKNSDIFLMQHSGNGVYEVKGLDVPPESEYRYVIVTQDNKINTVKDPYSKKQLDVQGWSTIYNPDNYEWKNTDWLEGKDSRRIMRKPNEPLRGLERLVIEEVNVPTLSDKGDFDSAKSHIDRIAERGIATAVEIMPVENTFSLQWGYDGVDKFAVNEKMGGAVEFKKLVDYIHGKGLNVILDIVPNHMGPDGDYLSITGPYESGSNKYGSVLNYENADNRYVRDYMANAALWWVNEFKVDGLRLDMTQFCDSDYLLKQIVSEINEHNPGVFLIAEDGRENQPNVTKYNDYEISHEDELNYIDRNVDEISKKIGHNLPDSVGFDSEWDFIYMNALKSAILEPNVSLLASVDNAIRNSLYRTKYTMSHDEIGNWDGTRLISKVITADLEISKRIMEQDEVKGGQMAARIGQNLAEFIVSDAFVNMPEDKVFEIEKVMGIKDDSLISKTDLINAMNTGIARQKLAFGVPMTVPGPKLYFQGDDSADLSYFKFFREFSDDKEKRKTKEGIQEQINMFNKGYDVYEPITRPECVLDSVKKSGMFSDLTDNMLKFNTDLAKLVKESPALLTGNIVSTFNDYHHNIHIHQLKQGDSEVLVIKNFGQGFHDNNYGYPGFPHYGEWQEVFNSDSVEYGGAGFSNAGRTDITSSNQKLSLSANSFIILKRVK